MKGTYTANKGIIRIKKDLLDAISIKKKIK